MSAPRIAAIVCTYQRYSLLARALASLRAQTMTGAEYQIIVVDNAPDATVSAAHAALYAAWPNLIWLHEPIRGLSRARNRAASATRAGIVAFLDDDAQAERGWLAAIVRSFQRFGDKAAVLGGRVDPRWEVPRPNWLHDQLLGYLSVVDWGGIARIAAEQEWVAGTNIAFRRQALLAVGGFCASLGRIGNGLPLLSNDETEVIARLRAAGQVLIYDPNVAVSHLVEASRVSQTWLRRRAAWQATSDFLQDPEKRLAEAASAWRGVLWFANRLRPCDRSLRALYVPLDDPELFRSQISAIYNYTIALLSGFVAAEPDSA